MKHPIITELEDRIASELSSIDVDSRYDDMLDECYDFSSVGGPFAHMSPSRVLRECDEVAYRCGKNDWLDGERDQITEVDGNYYEHDELERVKSELVSELETELSEVETAIEQDAEAENSEALDELKVKIAALESHSF